MVLMVNCKKLETEVERDVYIVIHSRDSIYVMYGKQQSTASTVFVDLTSSSPYLRCMFCSFAASASLSTRRRLVSSSSRSLSFAVFSCLFFSPVT